MDSGAARIIRSIRGAEEALGKDLRGEPKVLLSEERLLHQASQLALQAGVMHRTQMHAAKKLHSIEASLMQSTKHSSGAMSRAKKRVSIDRQAGGSALARWPSCSQGSQRREG